MRDRLVRNRTGNLQLPLGNLGESHKIIIQDYFNMQHVKRFNSQIFFDTYVENKSVEDFLRSFNDRPEYITYFLVGGPGSGKSTYIRKSISSVSGIPTYEHQSKTLVIPLFLNFNLNPLAPINSSPEELSKKIRLSLRNAVDVLIDKKIGYFDVLEFTNFVCKNLSQYLPLDYHGRVEAWVSKEANEYSASYAIFKLLYIISHAHESINNVEFIVDDIEGVSPIESQLYIIDDVSSVFYSFIHLIPAFEVGKASLSEVFFKLLIAVRPITYDLFRNRDNLFAVQETFFIKNPVRLAQIWKNSKSMRADKVKHKHYSVEFEKDFQNQMLHALSRSTIFGKEQIDILVGLFNNDIRESSQKNE